MLSVFLAEISQEVTYPGCPNVLVWSSNLHELLNSTDGRKSDSNTMAIVEISIDVNT